MRKRPELLKPDQFNDQLPAELETAVEEMRKAMPPAELIS